MGCQTAKCRKIQNISKPFDRIRIEIYKHNYKNLPSVTSQESMFLMGQKSLKFTLEHPFRVIIGEDNQIHIENINSEDHLYDDYPIVKTTQELFQVTKEQFIFSTQKIFKILSNNLNKKIYGNECVIEQSDCFWLGDTEFQVLETCHQDTAIKIDRPVECYEELFYCRYCQEAVTTQLNPMLRDICKCSGSLEWIHLECLRSWVKHQIFNVIGINNHSFMTFNLQCRQCNTSFPLVTQGYCLINPPKPSSKKYVQLSIKNQRLNNLQGVIVIDFNNRTKSSFGNSRCEIMVHQLQLYGIHAEIEKRGDKYILRAGPVKNQLVYLQGTPQPLQKLDRFIIDQFIIKLEKF